MIVFDLFKQTFKICIRLKLPTAISFFKYSFNHLSLLSDEVSIS